MHPANADLSAFYVSEEDAAVAFLAWCGAIILICVGLS